MQRTSAEFSTRAGTSHGTNAAFSTRSAALHGSNATLATRSAASHQRSRVVHALDDTGTNDLHTRSAFFHSMFAVRGSRATSFARVHERQHTK
jgi:hypothetical protein